jgi:hypothetical protein
MGPPDPITSTAGHPDQPSLSPVTHWKLPPEDVGEDDARQIFLDQLAAAGLSYSIVAHLRWDLRQIFRMAVSEGYLPRNPAELLSFPGKRAGFQGLT